MAEGRIDIDGWLVAEVEPYRSFGWGSYDYHRGGRLSLFRTATTWTLLSVLTQARYDENDHPIEGEASVRATTYTSVDQLQAELVRDEAEDWRRLVRSGASEPYHDPDLAALWAPVQIDHDLSDSSSIVRRDFGVRGERRQEAGWREEALALAVARLEEVGFVVLRSEVDYRKVFPRGLGGEWSNPVVGAMVVARLGYRVQLVVAIDGAGEIYTRSVDTNFTPGEKRRYPPRPLSEREHEVVDEAFRRRHAERERLREERSDDR
jgi:hypothetical protein